MGKSYMTIMVLNLPPDVTAADVETFFWCCGNMEKIQLQREEDGTQTALVTFKQPFAFKTALLLDEAFLGGRSVHVLPSMISQMDSRDGGRNQTPIQANTMKSNDDELVMDRTCYVTNRLVKLIKDVGSFFKTNPWLSIVVFTINLIVIISSVAISIMITFKIQEID